MKVFGKLILLVCGLVSYLMSSSTYASWLSEATRIDVKADEGGVTVKTTEPKLPPVRPIPAPIPIDLGKLLEQKLTKLNRMSIRNSQRLNSIPIRNSRRLNSIPI